MNYLGRIFITLLAALASYSSYAQSNVEEHLLRQTEQAQQRLQTTSVQIGNERQHLAQQLQQMELQVAKLREQAAAARRAQDEQQLSLQRLEERVDSWQEHYHYQLNQVHRTLQSTGLDYQQLARLTLAEKLARLDTVAKELLAGTQPDWQDQEVVHANGAIQTQPTLTLGPVVLIAAAQPDATTGVGRRTSDRYIRFDLPVAVEAPDKLDHSGRWSTTLQLDPSLGDAVRQQQNHRGPIAYLQAGGIWLIPILCAAVLSLIMALLKAWQLFRQPELGANSRNVMQQQLDQLFASDLPIRSKEEQAAALVQRFQFQLHRGITVTSVIATIAPLLGLLGTVSGMITTFNMMALHGTSEPQVVSGGIGQALITTEMGLIVAIPSLLLSAVLSRKAKQLSEAIKHYAVTQFDLLQQAQTKE